MSEQKFSCARCETTVAGDFSAGNVYCERCGAWICSQSEVTPPKPLESPQETEQCPRCYSAVRYVRLWISGFTGNCTNPWHDSPEPKPAPQAEGFEDWWASPKLSIDYDDAEDIVHQAWSAAQAPLLQKIDELGTELRDTKRALELACANDTWTAADYLMAAKGNDDE